MVQAQVWQNDQNSEINQKHVLSTPKYDEFQDSQEKEDEEQQEETETVKALCEQFHNSNELVNAKNDLVALLESKVVGAESNARRADDQVDRLSKELPKVWFSFFFFEIDTQKSKNNIEEISIFLIWQTKKIDEYLEQSSRATEQATFSEARCQTLWQSVTQPQTGQPTIHSFGVFGLFFLYFQQQTKPTANCGNRRRKSNQFQWELITPRSRSQLSLSNVITWKKLWISQTNKPQKLCVVVVVVLLLVVRCWSFVVVFFMFFKLFNLRNQICEKQPFHRTLTLHKQTKNSSLCIFRLVLAD